MNISIRGMMLVQSFEGCRLEAYEDVVGVWTIGYGHTDEDVLPGLKISMAEAATLLRADLDRFEQAVENACAARPPNQNQFDAMVSLAFNIGVEGFEESSVLRNHLKGKFAAAARSFALWNKAGGKVWAGLTRRRAAEAALYMEPMPNA